jgi:hypothetical protein
VTRQGHHGTMTGDTPTLLQGWPTIHVRGSIQVFNTFPKICQLICWFRPVDLPVPCTSLLSRLLTLHYMYMHLHIPSNNNNNNNNNNNSSNIPPVQPLLVQHAALQHWHPPLLTCPPPFSLQQPAGTSL